MNPLIYSALLVDRLEEFLQNGGRMPIADWAEFDLREAVGYSYHLINTEQIDILSVRHQHQGLSRPDNQPRRPH